MSKKAKTFKINLPFIEYTWYKEITEKETPDIKIIEKTIDSFLFTVQYQNDFNMSFLKEELIAFAKIIVGKAPVIQLSEEYKEKFLVINQFVKKYFDVSPRLYKLY